MNEDIYDKLRAHLDSMPAGFPETGNGAEIKILKKFFTPQEAEIALHVNSKPEKAETIASRLTMDQNEAVKIIHDMSMKGNLFRLTTPSGSLYMIPNFIMGMYEWHVNAVDKEIAEYADHIYDALADKQWKDKETKQFRIVPVNKSVDAKSHVNSYDLILELVKARTPYAVSSCICRVEQTEKGNSITRPLETCFTFGSAATYYIQNGIGRELTFDELQQKFDECEKAALIPLSTNAKYPVNMCMCDRDSCQLMRYLRKLEKPALQIHSSFYASIDENSCIGCGKCITRCQIDAISESRQLSSNGRGIHSIDQGRCIGCGLCVKSCPRGSIKMIMKDNLPEVPQTPSEMNIKIAQERFRVEIK